MSGIVRPRRALIDTSEIRAGYTVRGATWSTAAALTNWVLGRGAQLIPAYTPGPTNADVPDYAMSAGSTYTFQYYFRPRYQAVQRIWCFTLSGSNNPVTITVPAGGTSVTATARPRETTQPVRVVESLSAQSDTEASVSITIAPTVASTWLDSVSCFEVPRAFLTESTTNDRGNDTTELQHGQPVLYESVQPMVGTVTTAAAIGRRASLLQWSVPATVSGSTSTSFAVSTTSTAAAGVDVLDRAVPALARKTSLTGLTGSVRVRFLVWTNGLGTSGQIRFTSSENGSTSWIDVSSATTSPTWTSAATLTVDCEDPAAADGRQDATWDDMNAQIRSADGVCRIYCAAISAWEN